MAGMEPIPKDRYRGRRVPNRDSYFMPTLCAGGYDVAHIFPGSIRNARTVDRNDGSEDANVRRDRLVQMGDSDGR